MGGGAFAHASAEDELTLNTPRMSPDEYRHLKSIYLKRMQDYFPDGKVACLTEAPEKVDYGDMDIFVAIDERVDFVTMARQLGVAGVICRSSGTVQKCTLGVSKDGSTNSRATVVYDQVHGNDAARAQLSTAITAEEYAQIDVEIVPSELLDWHTFYSSYGDMAGLLGHIVHNLGFTVSDRGLWLRMRELDFSKTVPYVNIADRDGMLLLSSDPKAVIPFLGLSVESYEAGFDTLDKLYEWLGACRLLSAEAIKIKRNNSHERNREQKRTVFSRFFNEWLPERQDVNPEQDKQQQTEKLQRLRQQCLDEAVDSFSKRLEYEAMHDTLVFTLNNATAANLLKPLIAQHSGKESKLLNEIVRGFRRYVRFNSEGQPVVLETPHSDAESELHNFLGNDHATLMEPEAVSDWVREHWEEVRVLERQRIKLDGSELP